MNTISIKRKLETCRRCDYLCAACPYALPCAKQGQQVRPVECYLCWHNEGTVLPADCRLRCEPAQVPRRKLRLAKS